ncbi:MAG: hypothetical protein ACRBI6_08105 [Acidimicrobiales bacterium]
MPAGPARHLAFLHTAEVHRSTFEALVAELDPTVVVTTIVDADLLRRAQLDPDDPTVEAGIDRAIEQLRTSDRAICTCSTIGALAEERGAIAGVAVDRVDRAMAERAAALRGPVVAVVAVESTIEPTQQLLAGAGVTELEIVVAEGAWTAFGAGELDGYLDTIEATARQAATRAGVVVLAQASMAAVAERCDGRIGDVPVLASPRLAVEAALAEGAP